MFSGFGISVNRPLDESTTGELLVAIGSGITSRKLAKVNETNIGDKFQFFHTFLPSFCHTASRGFVYRFYLAYDRGDQVFADQRLRDAFQRQFHAATASGYCRDRDIATKLSLVECHHAGKPTWAQNDAMLEAYLDHVDYFYRVNDDTRMHSGGWTEKFIATLENYDPPRVGVVGPNHSGGNVGILTYDFVHRTHIEIFGFYYPRIFTAWYADNWVTQVYSPQRSTKLADVHLTHTMALGRRYNLQSISYNAFAAQINTDKQTVSRYVITMKTRKSGN